MSNDVLKDAFAGKAFLLFDGAMGTMLQQRGLAAGELPELMCLEAPEVVADVHRAYVEAGSQVITTNTFGANERKLGDATKVFDVYQAAVQCARDAGAPLVAADIGPIGELLFPMGDLSFMEACSIFETQAKAAADAGADLVIVETMADVLEMTAAVLAVRESCELPVFATMTFTASGRTFMGSSPVDAALALSALGVDALGVNCSAGPVDLQPVVFEMLKNSACPVIVQANAGLPQVTDGVTTYSLSPGEYAQAVAPMIEAGATIVGGCCGTDPEYIRALSGLLDGLEAAASPLDRETAIERARAVADEGGRDGDILAEILDAPDYAGLKAALDDL